MSFIGFIGFCMKFCKNFPCVLKMISQFHNQLLSIKLLSFSEQNASTLKY